MKFNGRWLPDFEEYRKECLKIAQELRENPGGSRFKQNPVYKKIINNDNRSRETAEAFYNHIEQYRDLFHDTRYDSCFKNDTIGSPTIYEIGDWKVSPGTLRYIKTADDIDMWLQQYWGMSVVEIGGGYGGQAVCLFGVRSDTKYTIIDIPEAIEVSKAYLGALGITANFMSCEAIEQREYDLVISDYCISEMNKEGIDFYFDNVIKFCKAGYFTCNKIGETDYLIERLKELFTLEIVPEFPKTSKHDNIIIYAKSKT